MIISIVVVITLLVAGISFMSGTFTSLPGAVNSTESEADYIIYKNDIGTTIARNGTNGRVDYSSMNSSQVIQDAIDNLPTYGSIVIKDDITIDTALRLKEGLHFKFQNITLIGNICGITANDCSFVQIEGVKVLAPAGYNAYAVYLTDVRNCKVDIDFIYCLDLLGNLSFNVGFRLQSNGGQSCYYNNIHIGMISGFQTGLLYYATGDGNVNSNSVRDTQIDACYVGVSLGNAVDGMAVSFNYFSNVMIYESCPITGHSYGFTMMDSRASGLRVISNQFVDCVVADADNTTYGITLGQRCDAEWWGGMLDSIMTTKINLISATNSTLRISDCYNYINRASGSTYIAAWMNNTNVYPGLSGAAVKIVLTSSSNVTGPLYVNAIHSNYFEVYSTNIVPVNITIYWCAEM